MASPYRNRRTRNHQRNAYVRAASLGKVIPVPDSAVTLGPTGVPMLTDEQVYVTPAGARFHTEWCQTIADAWDRNPDSVVVTLLRDVGARTQCGTCLEGDALLNIHV